MSLFLTLLPFCNGQEIQFFFPKLSVLSMVVTGEWSQSLSQPMSFPPDFLPTLLLRRGVIDREDGGGLQPSKVKSWSTTHCRYSHVILATLGSRIWKFRSKNIPGCEWAWSVSGRITWLPWKPYKLNAVCSQGHRGSGV